MLDSFFGFIARAWRILFGGSPMASVVPRIGDLRDRVRVERRVRLSETDSETWDQEAESWQETQDDWLTGGGGGDGAGNYQSAWRALISNRSAKIEPTRAGGEEVIAGRLTGISAYDIWLRRDSETSKIAPGDRIIDARDESRIFNIRWIGNLDGRGQFLLLQCQAGVAD